MERNDEPTPKQLSKKMVHIKKEYQQHFGNTPPEKVTTEDKASQTSSDIILSNCYRTATSYNTFYTPSCVLPKVLETNFTKPFTDPISSFQIGINAHAQDNKLIIRQYAATPVFDPTYRPPILQEYQHFQQIFTCLDLRYPAANIISPTPIQIPPPKAPPS